MREPEVRTCDSDDRRAFKRDVFKSVCCHSDIYVSRFGSVHCIRCGNIVDLRRVTH